MTSFFIYIRFSFIFTLLIMFCAKKYFATLVLFVSAFFSLAQNTYTLKPATEPIRISKQFLYFKDETNTLSFDDVIKSNDFKPIDVEVPNYDITKATIWGKLKLTCTEEEQWYLSIDPPTFNQVSVFQKRGGGTWVEKKEGNAIASQFKTLPVNHLFYKLNLKPGDTTFVIFKLREHYPIQIDITAGTLLAFMQKFHYNDLYNCICFGIIGMMLLYNLYLFITQKERAYLYYILYVFFSLAYTAYLDGYGLHFPAFLLNTFIVAPILPPTAFGFFLTLFNLQLFKGKLPNWWVKSLYAFCALAAGIAILGFFDYKHLGYTLLQVFGLLLGILSVTSAIMALLKGHNGAKFYLVGLGAYLSGLAYLILSGGHLFSGSVMTAFLALTTGSTIESIMLSFALGDKMKSFLREKEKAQEEALQQAKENERLVREQNAMLEQKVTERTAEVTAQKHLLEEKQKEILDSIRYAKRIQTSLLPTESYITSRLNKLLKK
jgi:two-component system NtrC family sensor kinase